MRPRLKTARSSVHWALSGGGNQEALVVGHDVDSYREFEPETDRAREEGQQAPEAPLPPNRHGQEKKYVKNKGSSFGAISHFGHEKNWNLSPGVIST